MYEDIKAKKEVAVSWFRTLRDSICDVLTELEETFGDGSRFQRQHWSRDGGGGGEISLLNGSLFEKAGVNVSTVFGHFNEKFAHEIPGTANSSEFWACGVSVVIHMNSPFIPAIHMNTRMIVTEKAWFGGGTDLTPTFEDSVERDFFHSELRQVCDRTDLAYYPKFKEGCDRYFFLPHRSEPRGIGGIFYDYLNTRTWSKDFAFNCDVGASMPIIFKEIVTRKTHQSWNDADKAAQLLKRGRYVEFNLLYDRGTKFGLMTNGNTEAILMSLPPYARW